MRREAAPTIPMSSAWRIQIVAQCQCLCLLPRAVTEYRPAAKECKAPSNFRAIAQSPGASVSALKGIDGVPSIMSFR